MIPKIIHYRRFGDSDLPQETQKFIKDWKKKCPDYEIKLWNEKNFDIEKYEYTKQAYKHKKFAFVSDVARLYALYHEWGIYFDTDVEILKNFDDLLVLKSFIGFEWAFLGAAIMGAEKWEKRIKEFLDFYEKNIFVREGKKYVVVSTNYMLTNRLKKIWLKVNNKTQSLENWLKVFSSEYFYPKDYISKKVKITKNSYSIHHYDASRDPNTSFQMKIFNSLDKIWIYNFLAKKILDLDFWVWKITDKLIMKKL